MKPQMRTKVLAKKTYLGIESYWKVYSRFNMAALSRTTTGDCSVFHGHFLPVLRIRLRLLNTKPYQKMDAQASSALCKHLKLIVMMRIGNLQNSLLDKCDLNLTANVLLILLF